MDEKLLESKKTIDELFNFYGDSKGIYDEIQACIDHISTSTDPDAAAMKQISDRVCFLIQLRNVFDPGKNQ
jgi:hypothetical protein